MSLLCTPRRLLLAGLFSACISGVAAAEDDATTGIARERFKEGVQFFDQKQYEKARAAFLQAYALKRHPAVLLNLAQSELRSGHEADAAKHFAQFLREAKEATEAERQSADSGLTAAKAVVAELAVNVDEDGAVVTVDGNSEGQSPLPGPVYLTPGSHSITAKKEGREVSVQLTAVAGQSTSTNLRLRKAAAAAAPASEGDADKGDKDKPEKPSTSESGGSAETGDSHEAAPSASVSTESSSRHRVGFFEWAAGSPVAWVGGGLTAVGIAGGIGFALGSRQNYDHADDVASQIRTQAPKDGISTTDGICQAASLSKLAMDLGSEQAARYAKACNLYVDYVDKGDNMKTLSLVSWVVAGAAAATTVVVYIFDGTAPNESAKRTPGFRANVAPWVSGTERGLFVTGSF
ncbi:MAG: PEGA domain-containing protein [Myxococcota bacterium]